MTSHKSILVVVCVVLMSGCAGQSNSPAQGTAPTPVASTGACNLDAARICSDSQKSGTLEAPRATGYATAGSTMPDTARVEIPNGPTVQVMCYYNPQHTALGRTDWTSSAAIDASSASYLKSKGYCGGN